MPAVTVGLLGGPYDGQLLAVPGNDDGVPPDEYIVMERTGLMPERLPPLQEMHYRRAVNWSIEGPLWFYVHPSVTLP